MIGLTAVGPIGGGVGVGGPAVTVTVDGDEGADPGCDPVPQDVTTRTATTAMSDDRRRIGTSNHAGIAEVR